MEVSVIIQVEVPLHWFQQVYKKQVHIWKPNKQMMKNNIISFNCESLNQLIKESKVLQQAREEFS